MQTINLKQYYPFCKEDICVEVSDEIVEAFLLDKRAEAARNRFPLRCNIGCLESRERTQCVFFIHPCFILHTLR